MRKFILYNPLAGHERGLERARELEAMYIGQELIYTDVTTIDNFKTFFSELQSDDDVILCGGDGSLSRFVNSIEGIEINNNILYYASGTGNDFLRDLGKPNGSEPFRINHYIEKLPYVYINGKKLRFVNGVGYGLDGHVCEVGNRKREKTKKGVNFTLVALKALLYAYRPRNATITIDGITKQYNNVWLTPTMKGRFLGAGMMIAPDRRRDKEDVSVVIVHGCSRLRLLTIFPKIFKGTHIKYKNIVEVHSAKEVTIEYDEPCAMQIDGETITDVKKYTVKVPSRAAAIVK